MTGVQTCALPISFDARYDWLERANESDVIRYLLSAAGGYGIKVYLGTVASESCDDTSGDADETGKLIDYYLANFGTYPSLAGWYLGNESYIQDARWLTAEIDYFAPQVAAIRARSNLPILQSPYLVNQWPGSPDVAAECLQQFLAATGIDVAVYEDAMGGRTGEYLGLSTYPTIGDYFASMAGAVGRERLWVVHEVTPYPYVPADGVTSITRLNQAISLVPDSVVGGRLLWTQQYYMSDTAEGRSFDSQRMLAQYRATHGFGSSVMLPINEVLWVTRPSPDQSYLSSTLKDGIAGDPFLANDPEWVSAPGQSAFIVDLGYPRSVNWVNLYVANLPAAGVKVPGTMVVFGSLDGASWYSIDYWSPLPGTSSDRDIGTQSSLSAYARFLWIYLANDATTKLSEIEVIGQ